MNDASTPHLAHSEGVPAGTPGPAPAYRERLLPGAGGWIGAVTFAGLVAIALWPVESTVATVVALVVLVAGLAALVATSPVVTVDDGTFRAGRARIPVGLLGAVTTLDAPAMREQLGPRLDARAYVCLRAWARTGVHVALDDPQDPTPYWLVSTRHPQRLAEALRAAR